jgi:beta-aspartyl-peptidase (threonine type)
MRFNVLTVRTDAGRRRGVRKVYPETAPHTESSVQAGLSARFSSVAAFALVCALGGAAGGCAASNGSPGDASRADHAAAPPSFAVEEAAVRALLAEQAAAWNRADLEGFMAGYWRSEHLVFASKDGVTHGHAATLARYRKSYDTPEKFGRLAFTDLVVGPVDEETAVVTGAWRLVRAKDEPHGRFVLIVRKFPEGWRVVSDYTTSAS